VVLSLKYRPKKFEDVVGQRVVIETLTNGLERGKVANCYLFSGIRGSGKTSTARILAKALQCEAGISPNPCLTCSNCRLAEEGNHPDIIELDAASRRRIEDIREIIEQSKYPPSIGRFKIFILDEVHMLTPEAFNALLKLIEEPPPFIKFIMATTEPTKIPDTILSRAFHLHFRPVPEEELTPYLMELLKREGIEFEEEGVRLVAKAGRGSVRDSLTILEQVVQYGGGKVVADKVVEVVGIVPPSLISQVVESVLAGKKGEVVRQIPQLARYDLESVVAALGEELQARLGSDTLQLTVAHRFFTIIGDGWKILKLNPDPKFFLSYILLRMVEASKPLQIEELIAELEGEIESPARLFDRLVEELKSRDEELGVCFETSIKFISFHNGVLKWESCPEERCKKLLRRYFALVIKPLIDQIFGPVSKIEVVRCTEKKPPSPPPVKEGERGGKEANQFPQLEEVTKAIRLNFGTQTPIEIEPKRPPQNIEKE